MRHFTPTYKFANADIMVSSYAGMSDTDQIIRSFQQGNLTNVNALDEIMRNSEQQFKEKLKFDRELAGQNNAILNNILSQNAEFQGLMNKTMDSVYEEMRKSNAKLELQHAAMLEQYRISNAKMDVIIELMKLPEFEKERLFLIEKAMNFLKQTFIDVERYKDALDYLLKADNGNDYIVLKQIGLIYLYGENSINLKKAIEYFENAYSYANSAEDNVEKGAIAKHISYAYFISGQLKKSIEWANTGLSINYDYALQAIKAEALMIIGEKTEGIAILEEISKVDIDYLKDATEKPAFQGEELNALIEKFKEAIKDEIDELSEFIENDSKENKRYEDIKNNIDYSDVFSMDVGRNELKLMKDLIAHSHESNERVSEIIKKRIQENKNSLTEEQKTELFSLVKTDPYKTKARLDKYIQENAARNTVEFINTQKRRYDTMVGVIWGITLIGAIIGLVLCFNGGNGFWYGLGSVGISYFIVRKIYLDNNYGVVPMYILGWMMALMVVFKLINGIFI